MNYFSQAVTITIAVGQSGIADEVRADSFYDAPLDACVGAALSVETASGEVLGEVEGEACPGWTLIISADGTLDYLEGTLDFEG